MRDELKQFNSKQIIIEDGSQFYYTVQPFEMKNILGAVIAVLDEYAFTKKGTEETFKLYRTNEGNWYDVNDKNVFADSSLLLALKNAINSPQITPEGL